MEEELDQARQTIAKYKEMIQQSNQDVMRYQSLYMELLQDQKQSDSAASSSDAKEEMLKVFQQDLASQREQIVQLEQRDQEKDACIQQLQSRNERLKQVAQDVNNDTMRLQNQALSQSFEKSDERAKLLHDAFIHKETAAQLKEQVESLGENNAFLREAQRQLNSELLEAQSTIYTVKSSSYKGADQGELLHAHGQLVKELQTEKQRSHEMQTAQDELNARLKAVGNDLFTAQQEHMRVTALLREALSQGDTPKMKTLKENQRLQDERKGLDELIRVLQDQVRSAGMEPLSLETLQEAKSKPKSRFQKRMLSKLGSGAEPAD